MSQNWQSGMKWLQGIVGGWIISLFLLLLISIPWILFPIIGLVALPTFLISIFLLGVLIPFQAYLLLGQTDRPPCKIFFSVNPVRCFHICLRTYDHFIFLLDAIPSVGIGMLKQLFVFLSNIEPNSRTSQNILSPFRSLSLRGVTATFGLIYDDQSLNKLDIYYPSLSTLHLQQTITTPQTPPTQMPEDTQGTTSTCDPVNISGSSDPLDPFPRGEPQIRPQPVTPLSSSTISLNTIDMKPVVVFVPDVGMTSLFTLRRWMFSLLGIKFSQMGYVVLIPDITPYPEGKIEVMCRDLRSVCQWAKNNLEEYGGDPDRIYICGHGLGGTLALLTLTQEAIVRAGEGMMRKFGVQRVRQRMPNGLRAVRCYHREVIMPDIKGLILLAPIGDCLEQIQYEARRWIEHLSPLRRIIGPSQTKCMQHSVTHLLFAARSILPVNCLPRMLVVGTGKGVIPPTQGMNLHEIVHGLGIPTTFQVFREMGHWGMIRTLMTGLEDEYSEALRLSVEEFVV
ncbi:hypothetical protein M231_04316 [Tremella mesenterica]|uniref:Alpha/beta hydrolase fold-3 domain-containing protein n=1 Tax=Tremella mesenterica TaxID=5217 RepID=A0A4V1M3X7_TREME|nr:hypothetical protein M231_04316 [Tremella mesenterica]